MKLRNMKFTSFLMLFSLTTVAVLLLIVGTVLYFKTVGFIDDKIDSILTMKLSQEVTVNVQKQFEDVSRVLEGMTNNRTLIQTVGSLGQIGTSAYEQAVLSQHLESLLFSLKKDNDFIERIVVLTAHSQYSSDQLYFAYSPDINVPLLFRTSVQNRFVPSGGTYDMLNIGRHEIDNEKLLSNLDKLNRTSYMISCISNMGGNESTVAIIVQMNLEKLEPLIPYDGLMVFWGSNGEILFHSAEIASDIPALLRHMPEHIQGKLIRGKRYYIRDIGFQDIRIAFAEMESDFRNRQLEAITVYCAAIFVGCCLLSLLLTHVLGGSMLRPLHLLIRWIGRYDQLDDRFEARSAGLSFYARMTMRDRLLVYFITAIVLPILLFVVLFYIHSTQVISRELQQTYYAAFEKTIHRIELFVKQKESALARLAYDSWVVNFVNDPNDKNRQELNQIVASYQPPILYQDIFSIYDSHNRLLYANRNNMKSQMPQSFFEEMQSTRKKIFYFPPTESGATAVSLGMAIVDLNRYDVPRGFITVDLDNVYFSAIYSDLKANGSVAFLIDSTGRMLSHPDPEKIGQTEEMPAAIDQLNGYLSQRDGLLYFAGKVGDLPWYLVSGYDNSVVRKQALELIYNDIYLLIIIFLLVMLFSYIMSQYLVRPLASIHSRFLDVALGDVRSLAKESDYFIDEVNQLQRSFNRMLDRIEQLVEQKLTDDQRQMMFQINALQAQINPHFLHNTLENIIFFIEEGDGARAVEMIDLLGQLFRYVKNRDNPLTIVRHELSYAMSYFKIMSFRYGERIECEWSVDREVEDGIIVQMVLQPLIENAIRHSIPVMEGVVKISVCCRREENDVWFEIADNGPGFPEERLSELREHISHGSGGSSKSVGLYNVHNRIRLHFGERYGLSLANRSGQGAMVTLRLPYTKDDSNEYT